MTVGIVGTGAIGFPIAEQIIKHGFELLFYARREEVIAELRERGAEYVSMCELGKRSDVVLLFPNTYEQCLECTEEILTGMDKGVIVVGATISPEEMVTLTGICAKRGVETVAAPVTGGVKGAKEGTLTVITSGRKETVDAVSPVLSTFGNNIVYVSDNIGAGFTMKLLVQLLVGINTVATGEALVLGVKNGLDPRLVYDTLCKSAGTSRIFENRGSTILERNFDKRGTIDILCKDITYSAELASRSGCPIMLGQACANVCRIGQNVLEDTSQDFSALVKLYEEWAGVVVDGREKKD